VRPLQLVALALGVGSGGLLAACFSTPPLTGPYRCDLGTCADPDLTCVNGLCCNPGGEPACEGGGGGDGGTDGGGGMDGGGGTDGGACTVPVPSGCTVPGTWGLCAAGSYSCAGGTLHCEQTVFPGTEICNRKDDDCDGVVDHIPGCPPVAFLGADPADAGFSVGAQRTLDLPTSGFTTCLKDRSGNTVEILDGGRWMGSGGVNHIVYAEVNNGGTWDLSRTNMALTFSFGGTLADANTTTPFAFFQPQVFLCGTAGSVLRLDPINQGLIVTASNTRVDVDTLAPFDGGAPYRQGYASAFFSLSEVRRIEILIAPAPNAPKVPAFDVDFTRLGVLVP